MAASIVVSVAVLFFVVERPKDDVAWLVYMAERMLHGERLYIDLVEVNPPLIVLMSAVPAWFAGRLGLPALSAFYVAAMIGVVLCAGMAASFLRGVASLFADGLRTTAFLVVVLALAPGADFAQREHLFAILTLPYLALLALRLRGGTVRPTHAALAGVLGGIGFALKPHFLLALALLELGAVRRGLRIVRSETSAMTIVLSVYALAIAVFFPAYLTTGVPLALAYWEQARETSIGRMLFDARYLLILGGLNLALQRFRRRPGRDPVLFVLAVFGVAAAAVYVVQWKGWFYHTLACHVALALRAAYLLATPTTLPQTWLRWSRVGVGLSVLVAGLGALAGESYLHANGKHEAVQQLASLVRREGARSLLVLSRSLSPAFPVVNQTGVVWASRFDTTWALVDESSQPRKGSASGQDGPILRMLVEDIVVKQPDLVAISARDAGEYLGTLSQDPAFVQAWSEYREIPEIRGLRVFTHTHRRWD